MVDEKGFVAQHDGVDWKKRGHKQIVQSLV